MKGIAAHWFHCPLLAALFLVACGRSGETPAFRPHPVRGVDLKVAVPPAAPALGRGNTADEAEIQFRAAFRFYETERWLYAARAFAEALDYDEDRDDARFYLGASLLMADRTAEALPHLEALMESAYQTPARALLAVALYRMGRAGEARRVVEPAVTENFQAAGWAARYDLLFGWDTGSRAYESSPGAR